MKEQDIIALKTKELDDMPGLLLGLDGWILRSVPKNYRKKFLEGYEKTLQIAFHPDRYPDEATKQSRQRYLQAVSEAISYITKDEFNFEMAADTVPTKRNPFVALQNNVNIRDNIIEKLHEQLEELQKFQHDHVNTHHKLHGQVTNLLAKLKRLETRTADFNKAIVRAVKSFPVPMDAGAHQVKGFFVDILKLAKDFDAEVVEAGSREMSQSATLVGKLNFYTSEKHSCSDSDWVTENIYAAQFAQYGNQVREINFAKDTSLDKVFQIEGAMTVAHLCEYLREHRAATPGLAWMYKAWLLLLEGFQPGKAVWSDVMENYTLPFYTSGMFLLLKKHTKKEEQLQVFFVQQSDYTESPNWALVRGLKKQVHHLKLGLDERVMKMKAAKRVVRQKVAGLRYELATERKKVKLYEKEFIKCGIGIPMLKEKPILQDTPVLVPLVAPALEQV